ncbi:MAG: hypothetical protein ABR559_00120 [Gemmatimonadota bacterium]
MSPSRPPEAPQPTPVACPHCGSLDVAVEALFGSSLMTRQFYCRGCRTVFEWVKWEAADDPAGWLSE